MFFRLVILIILIVVVESCDFISPKKTTLSNTELTDTVIDFNEVDVYPLFMDCNNCDSSDKQNLCFEMELIRRLQKKMARIKWGTADLSQDTVMVDILVNTEGKISIADIRKNAQTSKNFPELDSVLYKSIASLPAAVQPSLKRGIPVSSMFTLPVVLSLSD